MGRLLRSLLSEQERPALVPLRALALCFWFIKTERFACANRSDFNTERPWVVSDAPECESLSESDHWFLRYAKDTGSQTFLAL